MPTHIYTIAHMPDPIEFYRCLADPTRLHCLLLIQQEGELCVCELMRALDDSQPKISRHLARLRACELLLDRRQGQWVFYRINPALERWAVAVLELTREGDPQRLQDSDRRLRSMGDRPQRVSLCC